MTRPPRVLPTLAFFAACTLAFQVGCQGKQRESAPDAEAPAPAEATPGEPSPGDAKPSATPQAPAPAEPLALATQAAPGKARAKLHYRSMDRGIGTLRALEATPTPVADRPADDPSAPGSATRDDNLNTAWRCTPTGDQTCALGFRLPAPGKVQGVVFFGAAGPRWRDYRSNPRPKTVRIHTDAGYFQVELKDGNAHRAVAFAEPVDTASVVIEVVDVHPGKGGSTVHLAEVEIMGTAGTPRAPLPWALDRTLVTFDGQRWKAGSEGYDLIPQFLETWDGTGEPRRLMRGSAVYGHGEDRAVLVEHIRTAQCPGPQGVFFLVDRQTRRRIWVGDLGGLDRPVHRHLEGRGFAVGDATQGYATIVIEGDKVKRRTAKTLEAFELEPLPRTRAASLVAADPLPEGCQAVTATEAIAKLTEAPRRVRRAYEAAAGSEWAVCKLGEQHTLQVHGPASCRGQVGAYVLDGAGKAVAHRTSRKDSATDLRLRPLGQGWALEFQSQTRDTAYFAGPQGDLVALERPAGFEVRTARACEPCQEETLAAGGTAPAGAPLDPAPPTAAPVPPPAPKDAAETPDAAPTPPKPPEPGPQPG